MTAFAGIATAWRPLCEELEVRLERLDPPGELLGVGVDSSGVLSFEVRLDPGVRAKAGDSCANTRSARSRCVSCAVGRATFTPA